MRVLPEELDVVQPFRSSVLVPSDLVSDDDRSVAADSWSIKSEYGSTLDDDQRQADAMDMFSCGTVESASDYCSFKEDLFADGVTSMQGFLNYWDETYAKDISNFLEHGHAGEIWFGNHVMVAVASWSRRLCLDAFCGRVPVHANNMQSDPVQQFDKNLSAWSVLDIGTGNGLLLHELAKQGFTDLTGTDYCEKAIVLACGLAARDGYSSIKFLVDDILHTKLDRQFQLVMDKGTLDAIGMHPDGPNRRITYWDTVSKLVAPEGILVITSCNSTRDELVSEADCMSKRGKDACPAGADSSPFKYLSHVRTYPTFGFGGCVGTHVATVAFLRNNSHY